MLRGYLRDANIEVLVGNISVGGDAALPGAMLRRYHPTCTEIIYIRRTNDAPEEYEYYDVMEPPTFSLLPSLDTLARDASRFFSRIKNEFVPECTEDEFRLLSILANAVALHAPPKTN